MQLELGTWTYVLVTAVAASEGTDSIQQLRRAEKDHQSQRRLAVNKGHPHPGQGYSSSFDGAV